MPDKHRSGTLRDAIEFFHRTGHFGPYTLRGGEGDPPAGDPPGGDPPAGDPPKPGGEDVSGLKSALSAERETNKALKAYAQSKGLTVEQLLKQLGDADEAGKSELQRITGERDAAQKRADEAEARAKTVAIRAALIAEATKAGAKDPEAVYLLAVGRGAPELDAEGKVTNAEKLIADTRTATPALFGAASIAGGAGAKDEGDGGDDVTPGIGRLRAAYGENKSKPR